MGALPGLASMRQWVLFHPATCNALLSGEAENVL